MVQILSGKQVRLKRIEHDLSMNELARRLNVTPTWMSLVENGKQCGEPVRSKATVYFQQIEMESLRNQINQNNNEQ